MKKLAYAATAFASLFMFAGPVGATWFWPMPSNDVTVENMFTDVKNVVSTKAISVNDIGGKYVFGGTIDAGQVLSSVQLGNTVNMTALDICGDCISGDVKVKNMFTDVDNYVFTKAVGSNEIGGMKLGGFWTAPKITSDTVKASAIIVNDVNTTIFGDLSVE